MLEVVSTTREEELRSVAAAAEIGVDWLLGGTHPEDGLKVLNGAATRDGRPVGEGGRIRYCPFPGTVVGHPSVLQGTIADIADSARQITSLDGVFGLDLLAYRHQSADVAELTRAVVQAASGPAIGGAIFEGRLPGGPSLAGQVTEVLSAAAGGAGPAGPEPG
jgi:hypothetical protein